MRALEIFAAQQKEPEYITMFNELVNDDDVINQYICEELVRTLTYLDSEESFKPQMLDLIEKVQKQIDDKGIMLSSKLFDNLISVYTESQQWNKISSLLQNSTPENCTP